MLLSLRGSNLHGFVALFLFLGGVILHVGLAALVGALLLFAYPITLPEIDRP